MRFRTRFDLWGAALLSSLGAMPVACGGATSSGPDETGGTSPGTGGSSPGTGGDTTSAGQATGASPGTGGASAGGRAQTTGGGPSAGIGGAIATTGGRANTGGKATAGAGGAIVTPTGGAPSAGTGGLITPEGGFGGAGGAVGNPFPCTSPTPLVPSVNTGYEQCADGRIRRTAALECPSTLPRTATHPANSGDTCATDADCTEKAHGYCSPDGSAGQILIYRCAYGCQMDSECAANQICLCGTTIGTCVSAGCTTAADCDPGFDCASYQPRPTDVLCTSPQLGFACQTPDDGCGGPSHCPRPAPGWAGCDFNGTTRVCSSVASCAVAGRPFLVHGGERLAPLAARSDWLDPELEPSLAGLDAALRETLAERWARLGCMEHASIAAFARFALQLVSLGAPAELVEQATQALADETRHARACFAVASRYAGRSLGPGPLPIHGSLDATSLEEILLLTVREGCIGETVAALETLEASEHAEDPVIRDLLRRISADETRHAELAWRFVAWALAPLAPDAPERARVTAELEATRGAVSATRSAEFNAEARRLLAHGILPDSLSAALRSAVNTDIVLPCALALGLVQERRAPSVTQVRVVA